MGVFVDLDEEFKKPRDWQAFIKCKVTLFNADPKRNMVKSTCQHDAAEEDKEKDDDEEERRHRKRRR